MRQGDGSPGAILFLNLYSILADKHISGIMIFRGNIG